jgi:hypothetical protein
MDGLFEVLGQRIGCGFGFPRIFSLPLLKPDCCSGAQKIFTAASPAQPAVGSYQRVTL